MTPHRSLIDLGPAVSPAKNQPPDRVSPNHHQTRQEISMVGLTTPKNSTGSAYPSSVDALLPRVREWVAELGSTPSRNRIMGEFRVGAPKARAILDALKGEREAAPVRALHAVPEPAKDADPAPGVDTPS
jgi:hypothetical protein